MADMYYDRVLSPNFAKKLEIGGELRWLLDFVRKNPDLDIFIGKNKSGEVISLYRGLSRIIRISPNEEIDGAEAYKKIHRSLYGNKKGKLNFEKELEVLLSEVRETDKFDRYYKNEKEGYYQNKLLRKYGIDSDTNSEFVIIDREVVIGHKNRDKKEEFFRKFKKRYKDMQSHLSEINSIKYGENLNKKSIGDELDFLALDKEGNILLIEFKHGGKGCNTSGIYLSPLQIGLYYDIFTEYHRKPDFENTIFQMLKQKQEIGLINPDWQPPTAIKELIPILVISEFNYKSSAKEKYKEIMKICRKIFGEDFLSNIRTYNFSNSQLKPW